MPEYRLSKLARLDLIEIADYTVDIWGFDQANRYLDGLYDCFAQITRSPGIGRPCDKIRAGYRQMDHEKHVIIYRIEDADIFISRILHQRMLPSKHVIQDF